MEECDAIVLGAGEAGALVASLALEAGKRVVMVYRPPYGSTCLNTGCVPSKFMIHRARVAHQVRTAARYHVAASAPQVDLAAIVREKQELVTQHREEAFQGARAAERLTLLEGAACFTAEHTVAVGNRTFTSGQIFIATGMRPLLPPIEGLDRVPVLTNENVMDLSILPEHLVVVGGGYIACELGQAFRRYGAAVTIVQGPDHLVPGEEPDASLVLEQAFEAEGITVLLGQRATRVEPAAGGVRVHIGARNGGGRVIEGSHLLVAAGRRPNTDTLRLGAAGIATDQKGFVRVDDSLATNIPGIWAIGDVNGQQPFTRVCQEEAKVAFVNAFQDGYLRMPRQFLGHAIFTDPEIGSVGLTEQAARDAGHDVIAGLVTLDQVSKAQLNGETQGFIKYVADRQTHRLLGCHVIGADGADLVYDAAVVMRHGGRLEELAFAVGVFPTLQEGMEGAARALLHSLAPEEVAGPLVTAPIG